MNTWIWQLTTAALVFLALYARAAPASEHPTSRPAATAEEALKQLLDTSDYRLASLPHEWRHNLAEPEQRLLVVELLARIRSAVPLQTTPLDGLPSPGPLKALPTPATQPLRRSVTTVGQRCVWALGELLSCEFPMYPGPDAAREQMDAFVNVVTEEVLLAMRMPPPIETWTLEQRLQAAETFYTNEGVLDRLVRDPDPRVRLAVARHPAQPTWSGLLLRDDPDPDVRKAAWEIGGVSTGRSFTEPYWRLRNKRPELMHSRTTLPTTHPSASP